MKIIRSTKCSLKFSSKKKIITLKNVLKEYSKVVNFYIDKFWEKDIKKEDLLKPIIDLSKSWLSGSGYKRSARHMASRIGRYTHSGFARMLWWLLSNKN